MNDSIPFINFRQQYGILISLYHDPFNGCHVRNYVFRHDSPAEEAAEKEQEMRDSLQVGDEITTIGGIMGRVVTVKEDSLIIETGADRNKMRIARWAVQTNNTANEKLAAEREAAQAKAQEERAKRSAEEGGKKRRGRKKDLDEVSTAKAEETAQAKKDEE